MERPSIQELKLLSPQSATVEHLRHFPRMTSWFNPILLVKLLKPVILSGVFGEYADRRLIIAALDPTPDEVQYQRALCLKKKLQDGPQDEVWLDYVSDTGDGFDSTYAVAYLLAQPEITINDHTLKRGQLLVLGGDEVYPTALRDDYILRFKKPFMFALPPKAGEPNIPLFALPGNHDWYDGLMMFSAIFCREKPIPVGRWETMQRRSYFAAQITDNVWLWGVDIALVRDMDQPQDNYFTGIATRMNEGSSIILCTAEPGWYEGAADGDAYRTLGYATSIARKADRKLTVPIVLSGDSHHYARYQAENIQFITSGGGGAFAHGTLQLKPKLGLMFGWFGQKNVEPTLQHCYPTKGKSRLRLFGNLLFAPLNILFSLALGLIYFFAALAYTYIPTIETLIITYLILAFGLWGYSGYQEPGAKIKTLITSFLHAGAHLGAIWWLADFAVSLDAQYFNLSEQYWLIWVLYIAAISLSVCPMSC